MRQIETITVKELQEMSEKMYGSMTKAVVDLERQRLVVDMEMHVDGEQLLLEDGSNQDNLWGINLYPAKFGSKNFIEYDSMINIRPRQQNISRYVEDALTRQKIQALVENKVSQ